MTTNLNTDDQAVIAYRLSQVENRVVSLEAKLDKFIENYPTKEYLAHAIAPLKEELEDLKRERFQVRLALVAGIISPVAAYTLTRL